MPLLRRQTVRQKQLAPGLARRLSARAKPNPFIERTSQKPLRAFRPAAHVERWAPMKHPWHRLAPNVLCVAYVFIWAYAVWHYHASAQKDDVLIFLGILGMPANLLWFYLSSVIGLMPEVAAQEALMLLFGGMQYWLLGKLVVLLFASSNRVAGKHNVERGARSNP